MSYVRPRKLDGITIINDNTLDYYFEICMKGSIVVVVACCR